MATKEPDNNVVVDNSELMDIGWLKTREGHKFSPNTLADNIYLESGEKYRNIVDTQLSNLQSKTSTLEEKINEEIGILTDDLNTKTGDLDSKINQEIQNRTDSEEAINSQMKLINNTLSEELSNEVEQRAADIERIDTKLKYFNGEDSNTFYIIDSENNIIMRVDSEGVHSINLFSSGGNLNTVIESLTTEIQTRENEVSSLRNADSALQSYVDETNERIDNVESSLNQETQSRISGDNAIQSDLSQTKQNLTDEIEKRDNQYNKLVVVDNSLGERLDAAEVNIENINTKIQYFNGDESDVFYIVDSNNNVIMKVDSEGVHSINLISTNGNLNDLIESLNNEITTRSNQISTLNISVNNLQTQLNETNTNLSDEISNRKTEHLTYTVLGTIANVTI